MGWDSQIIVARQVIIGGTQDGLFVYRGVPGPGNPPVASISEAATDLFGNPILKEIVSYNPLLASQFTQVLQGGIFLGYPGNFTSGSIFEFGVAELRLYSGTASAGDTGASLRLFSASQGPGGNTPNVTLDCTLIISGGDISLTANDAGPACHAVQQSLTQANSNFFSETTIAAGTGGAFAARVVTDTISRFVVDSNGTHSWGPGGAAGRDTNLSRTAPNQLSVGQADLRVNTAGRGLQVAEGSNARMGVSTLVAGTVVVANTSVTANTRIFLTCQTPGGTPGFLRVSARTAGTSFTILSSSATDTSVAGWLLVEP